MRTPSRIEAAIQRVSLGEHLVAKQRARIARLREKHAATATAEHLLTNYEQTLKAFRDHLALLRKDFNSRDRT
jgi:hypothetical protein